MAWDTTTSQPIPIKEIDTYAHGLEFAFSPDGRRLAVVGEGNIVRIFNADSGKEQASFYNGPGRAVGLAFYADGRRLYAGSTGAGGVKVFDSSHDPQRAS